MSFAKEDQNTATASKYQSTSTVTSPTFVKNVAVINEIPEVNQAKKSPIQKKNSAKDVPSQKLELQPKISATGLTSPKANQMKEKVLISYGSEKNLNAIKPI